MARRYSRPPPRLIHQTDPDIVEEWKWRGVLICEHDGIICTGETYKDYVKTTFAKGASLPDPAGLVNASLAGGTRRAIDFRQGDKINEKAFNAMIRAAVDLNAAKKAKPAAASPRKAASTALSRHIAAFLGKHLQFLPNPQASII